MAASKNHSNQRTGNHSSKSTGSSSKKNSNHKPAAQTRKTTASSSSTGRKKLTAAQRRELERQERITQALIIVGSVIVAVIFIIIFLSLYGDNDKKDFTSNTADTSSSTPVSSVQDTVYPASEDFEIAPDGEQLKKPSKGEEVAVLETSMGTIKIRLFPKYAPTAVENFKTLIKEGYYNGIIFHRVVKDFVIQGGDPTGTGAYGQCAFEGYKSFGDEFGRNLYHFRGALSMANSGAAGSNESQFFIVQDKKATYNALGNKEGFIENGGAKWAAEQYEKLGGRPHLDGQFKSITGSGHTVFGQVYEGMKVVDKIAAVEVDGSYKPLEDVVIKKAYLTKVK